MIRKILKLIALEEECKFKKECPHFNPNSFVCAVQGGDEYCGTYEKFQEA